MDKLPSSLHDLKARADAARRAFDPPFEHERSNLDGHVNDVFQYVVTGPVQDRLKWPSYFNSEADFKNRARADWQNVDRRILEFSQRLLVALAREKVPFYVHAAYRDRVTQNAAVARGNSKTPWPRASHCQGKAVDIVHSRYHWELSKPEWDWVGYVGKQVHAQMMKATPVKQRWQIIWGGDWQKPWPDPAHWEIADWRDDLKIPVDSEPVRLSQAPHVYVRSLSK